MVKLADVFDVDLFKRMQSEGYVRVRPHPKAPLFIANYSEKAQFDREWNDVTLNCRGLIYDDEGTVVARGFRKFFNWDDGSQPYPPRGTCLLSPKMDGSLGILYRFKDEFAVATRGSFISDQAVHATDWFRNGHRDLEEFRLDKTYLYEIIYPDNRIVVDYGQRDELVLLDVLDNATGKSDLVEFDSMGGPKVERKLIPGFDVSLSHDIPEGEEGFVLYWPGRDFRVKMKSADYVALHKLIFGLNEKSVWAQLGAGMTVSQVCEALPDEFHQWVRDVAGNLQEQAESIRYAALAEYDDLMMRRLPMFWNRRQFAEEIKDSPYRGYLFNLLDSKDIKGKIWDSLKPVGGGKSVAPSISEDVA